MYAHVLEHFGHDAKEEKNARTMYVSLMKKLGAAAFNEKR